MGQEIERLNNLLICKNFIIFNNFKELGNEKEKMF